VSKEYRPSPKRRPSATGGPPEFAKAEYSAQEVYAPDWINEELVQLATEEAIEDAFGKRLTLWSTNEDEASQHLQATPGASHGYLELVAGAPLFWHLLRIV
jgi:hypothetical protein